MKKRLLLLTVRTFIVGQNQKAGLLIIVNFVSGLRTSTALPMLTCFLGM